MFTRTAWVEIPMRAWLIEHPDGLILVDTGQNARFNEPGYLPRESLHVRRNLPGGCTPEQEVGPRMRALGFDPKDIRWTMLTHLHLDHDGGLEHVLDIGDHRRRRRVPARERASRAACAATSPTAGRPASPRARSRCPSGRTARSPQP